MRAVGKLIGKNSVGFHQAELNVNGNLVVYCVSNMDEIPYQGNFNVGLFEFCPEDQFCKWIDPNKS